MHREFEDRFGWGRLLGAGIWLLFLGNPLGVLVKAHNELWKITGILALGLFVAVYLVGLTRVRAGRLSPRDRVAWAYVGAMTVLTALVIPGAGDQAMTCLVFVAALAVSLLPKWQALAVVIILFTTTTVAGLAVHGWSTHGNNFAVLLASAAVWSFRLAWQRQESLMNAERELSGLAVEEERSRIARDLHDILGHSLTVVTVKAELAARLLDVDVDRARHELEDLQRLTRDALADVRATALGVRGISLPGEIASARSALESAGIDPRLPTVADEIPSRWRELFAWTIREGVTNVIRHSAATECEISLSENGVSVVDNGRGSTTHSADGHGIDGLRQRVALAGATLTTGPGPEGRGFALNVEVAS